MAGDGGVKTPAAPSQLQATQATARRMVEDDGVNRRSVPRQLLTTQATARDMVDATVSRGGLYQVG